MTFRWSAKDPPPSTVLESLKRAKPGSVIKTSGRIATSSDGRFREGSLTSNGSLDLPELELSHLWFDADQLAALPRPRKA